MSSEVTVGNWTPKVSAATYSRPADATAYTIGDLIGNSLTAASVVPISFTVARNAGGSGRITGARCTLTAASGTIVLPAFDLLLFRPEASIPFAAAGYPADNAALVVSAAAMKELLAVLAFSATTWRNNAGGTTAAGLAVWQAVRLAMPVPFNLFSTSSPPGALGGQALAGLLQAQNAWTPLAVVNSFDITLEVEQD